MKAIFKKATVSMLVLTLIFGAAAADVAAGGVFSGTVISASAEAVTSDEWNQEAIPLTPSENRKVTYNYSNGNGSWTLSEDHKTLTLKGSGSTKFFNPNDNNIAWHQWKDEVEKIVVEEGITELNARCFYNFSNLKSVTLPSSLKTIGYAAFLGCSSLKSITLPENVTNVHYAAFSKGNDHFEIELASDCRIADLDKAFYSDSSGDQKTNLKVICGETFSDETIIYYRTMFPNAKVTRGENNVADSTITFAYMHIPYTGTDITPQFTVKLGDTELNESNYEITSGGTGTEVGTQKLTIAGKGDYKGTKTAEWYIDKIKEYTVTVTNGTINGGDKYTEKTVATVVGDTDVGGWYINDKLVSSDKTYSFYVMSDTVLTWKDGTVDNNGIANMAISDRIYNPNGKVTVTMTSTWNLPKGAQIKKAGTYRCYVGLGDNLTDEQLKAQLKEGTFKASTLKTTQGTFYFNLNMGATSAAKKLCGMTYVQYTLNGTTYEIVSDIATSSTNQLP